MRPPVACWLRAEWSGGRAGRRPEVETERRPIIELGRRPWQLRWLLPDLYSVKFISVHGFSCGRKETAPARGRAEAAVWGQSPPGGGNAVTWVKTRQLAEGSPVTITGSRISTCIHLISQADWKNTNNING